MKRERNRLLVGAIPIVAIAALLSLWRVRSVSGAVFDENNQPIAGASVRIRATQLAALADGEGRFTLSGFTPALKVRVTAWAEGYYVVGRAVWPWDGDVSLTLSPYAVQDNESYTWIPPAVEERGAWEELLLRARLDPTAALAPDALFFKAAEGLTLGCRDCHGEVIYEQWVGGAHALGLDNLRFASMYNGTDLTGQQRSPPTRFGTSRDYGRIPLRPDSSQPYFGPGYKLDFPDTAGNCAACHLPAAALAEP